MIEYKSGDILREEAEALVNTVNCVGVMGRGIALQFKNAFPENFKAYAAACRNEEVQPGRMFVFETGHLTNPRYIINFPTKRHWRGKSRMEDIESGLNALADTIRRYNIHSIAIPPLGSGLGGLDWLEVRPRIEATLQPLTDVCVLLYEPQGAPATEKIVHNREAPTMTAGRAALIELMSRYLAGLLDPFVTLLEVHKLMYFMQEAGEPLRLKYQKGPYGPYAENLRHVLNAIEGHLVTGYADGGDAPDKRLELVPGAIEDAMTFLQQHPDTRTRFDKVANLVEGFESPFGLELLSTVHWVMKNESVNSVDDLVNHTYAWNDRKRQFTPRQIALAADVVAKQGWAKKLELGGHT
jgi:O-acetyl-ADP-ribose deacetylase (regulator of RNase III)